MSGKDNEPIDMLSILLESNETKIDIETIRRASTNMDEFHKNYLAQSNLKSGDEIQPPKKNEPSYKKRRKGF